MQTLECISLQIMHYSDSVSRSYHSIMQLTTQKCIHYLIICPIIIISVKRNKQFQYFIAIGVYFSWKLQRAIRIATFQIFAKKK